MHVGPSSIKVGNYSDVIEGELLQTWRILMNQELVIMEAVVRRAARRHLIVARHQLASTIAMSTHTDRPNVTK